MNKDTWALSDMFVCSKAKFDALYGQQFVDFSHRYCIWAFPNLLPQRWKHARARKSVCCNGSIMSGMGCLTSTQGCDDQVSANLWMYNVLLVCWQFGLCLYCIELSKQMQKTTPGLDWNWLRSHEKHQIFFSDNRCVFWLNKEHYNELKHNVVN